MLLPLCAAALLFTVPFSGPSPQDAAPSSWPSWQGPLRNGISGESEWNTEGRPEPRWQAELGLGYSNVSIAGGRLYTMGFDEENERDVVWCLDPGTGEEIWVHTYPSKVHANFHGGGTLTTPTIDGDRVYVSTRFGRALCLRAADGEVLWERDYLGELGLRLNFHGCSASPFVHGERLILMLSGVTIAVDKADGTVRWQTEDHGDGGYSNPMALTLNGRDCLVLFTGRGLAVVDEASGEQRQLHPWSHESGGINAATPILFGTRAFISAAYDKGAALIELGGDDPGFVWQNRRMRTKVSGCIPWKGYLYGFDESMLKCLDMEGNEVWRVRGLGMGTLSMAGGRLIVLSSRGELLIGEASPDGFVAQAKHKILDGGVYWVPPVLLDGLLYCRNSLGHLVCLDHRGGVPIAASTTPALAAEDLPVAATVLAAHVAAIGGVEAWHAHTSMQLDGSIEITGAGITRTPMTIHFAAPAQWHLTYSLGRFGTVERGYDGKVGWQLDPFYGNLVLEGDALRELAETTPLHAPVDWAATYSSLTTVARTLFADRQCWKVEAVSKGGATRHFFFDSETGLLRGRSGDTEAHVVLDEYRAFGGVRLPTLVTTLLPETGAEETLFIEGATFDQVPPEAFALPTEVQKMLWTPEEVAAKDAAARERHAAFLGVYLADFGRFQGAEFAIAISRGDLTMTIPGNPEFALEGPDSAGWFRAGPQLQARFTDVVDGVAHTMQLRLTDGDHMLPRKSDEDQG